jgi:hypothetical protein
VSSEVNTEQSQENHCQENHCQESEDKKPDGEDKKRAPLSSSIELTDETPEVVPGHPDFDRVYQPWKIHQRAYDRIKKECKRAEEDGITTYAIANMLVELRKEIDPKTIYTERFKHSEEGVKPKGDLSVTIPPKPSGGNGQTELELKLGVDPEEFCFLCGDVYRNHPVVSGQIRRLCDGTRIKFKSNG